jgi:hypothetical protein
VTESEYSFQLHLGFGKRGILVVMNEHSTIFLTGMFSFFVFVSIMLLFGEAETALLRSAVLFEIRSRNNRMNGESCLVFADQAGSFLQNSLFLCLKKPKSAKPIGTFYPLFVL